MSPYITWIVLWFYELNSKQIPHEAKDRIEKQLTVFYCYILLTIDANILMEKCISIIVNPCISFFIVQISEVVNCMGDVLDLSVATGLSPRSESKFLIFCSMIREWLVNIS